MDLTSDQDPATAMLVATVKEHPNTAWVMPETVYAAAWEGMTISNFAARGTWGWQKAPPTVVLARQFLELPPSPAFTTSEAFASALIQANVLVGDREIAQVIATVGPRERWPRAILEISSPAVGPSNLHALLYVSRRFAGLAGSGELVHLGRTGPGIPWAVLDQRMLWIS